MFYIKQIKPPIDNLSVLNNILVFSTYQVFIITIKIKKTVELYLNACYNYSIRKYKNMFKIKTILKYRIKPLII